MVETKLKTVNHKIYKQVLTLDSLLKQLEVNSLSDLHRRFGIYYEREERVFGEFIDFLIKSNNIQIATKENIVFIGDKRVRDRYDYFEDIGRLVSKLCEIDPSQKYLKIIADNNYIKLLKYDSRDTKEQIDSVISLFESVSLIESKELKQKSLTIVTDLFQETDFFDYGFTQEIKFLLCVLSSESLSDRDLADVKAIIKDKGSDKSTITYFIQEFIRKNRLKNVGILPVYNELKRITDTFHLSSWEVISYIIKRTFSRDIELKQSQNNDLQFAKDPKDEYLPIDSDKNESNLEISTENQENIQLKNPEEFNNLGIFAQYYELLGLLEKNSNSYEILKQMNSILQDVTWVHHKNSVSRKHGGSENVIENQFLNVIDPDFLTELLGFKLSGYVVVEILKSYNGAQKRCLDRNQQFVSKTILDKEYALDLIKNFKHRTPEILKFVVDWLEDFKANRDYDHKEIPEFNRFLINILSYSNNLDKIPEILKAIADIPLRYQNFPFLNSIFERETNINDILNILRSLKKLVFHNNFTETLQFARPWISQESIHASLLDDSLDASSDLDNRFQLARSLTELTDPKLIKQLKNDESYPKSLQDPVILENVFNKFGNDSYLVYDKLKYYLIWIKDLKIESVKSIISDTAIIQSILDISQTSENFDEILTIFVTALIEIYKNLEINTASKYLNNDFWVNYFSNAKSLKYSVGESLLKVIDFAPLIENKLSPNNPLVESLLDKLFTDQSQAAWDVFVSNFSALTSNNIIKLKDYVINSKLSNKQLIDVITLVSENFIALYNQFFKSFNEFYVAIKDKLSSDQFEILIQSIISNFGTVLGSSSHKIETILTDFKDRLTPEHYNHFLRYINQNFSTIFNDENRDLYYFANENHLQRLANDYGLIQGYARNLIKFVYKYPEGVGRLFHIISEIQSILDSSSDPNTPIITQQNIIQIYTFTSEDIYSESFGAGCMIATSLGHLGKNLFINDSKEDYSPHPEFNSAVLSSDKKDYKIFKISNWDKLPYTSIKQRDSSGITNSIKVKPIGIGKGFYHAYYITEGGQIISICLNITRTKSLIENNMKNWQELEHDLKAILSLSQAGQEYSNQENASEFAKITNPQDMLIWIKKRYPMLNCSMDNYLKYSWSDLLDIVVKNKSIILPQLYETIEWRIRTLMAYQSESKLNNTDLIRIMASSDYDLYYKICATLLKAKVFNGDALENSHLYLFNKKMDLILSRETKDNYVRKQDIPLSPILVLANSEGGDTTYNYQNYNPDLSRSELVVKGCDFRDSFSDLLKIINLEFGFGDKLKVSNLELSKEDFSDYEFLPGDRFEFF